MVTHTSPTSACSQHPERNLVFDVNDFDETLPAPWEWDVKRLAASVAVAARNLNIEEGARTAAVEGTVRAYRERMNELGADVATRRLVRPRRRATSPGHNDVEQAKGPQGRLVCGQGSPSDEPRRRLPKFTAIVEGRRRIVDKPPLMVHDAIEVRGPRRRCSRGTWSPSLPDRRPLLERCDDRGRPPRKVVGVGSVGTRCYLVLLMDHDGRTAAVPATEGSEGGRDGTARRALQVARTRAGASWSGNGSCRPRATSSSAGPPMGTATTTSASSET